MHESFRTRRFRWGFNLWPCFRGTGAWVAFIAVDWSAVRLRLEDVEILEIRRLLEEHPKVDRTYPVQLLDAKGVVHAEGQKVVHISIKKAS